MGIQSSRRLQLEQATLMVSGVVAMAMFDCLPLEAYSIAFSGHIG
jgi:hypothetical protein